MFFARDPDPEEALQKEKSSTKTIELPMKSISELDGEELTYTQIDEDEKVDEDLQKEISIHDLDEDSGQDGP